MTRKLLEQIQAQLVPHKVQAGLFLIHRTNALSFEKIIQTGLDTNVVSKPELPYDAVNLTITSTVTPHANLDRHFFTALNERHAGSTHHVVIHVPQHALQRIRNEIRRISAAQVPEALAVALNGRLPHQWIVGHLDVSSNAFVPHDGFHPEHRPELPNLQEAKMSFSPRKPRAIGDKAIRIPKASESSDGQDVW